MNIFDVVVIGGGASGMMAAITAAQKGKKVCILEHNTRIGTKILSTGNGKCNLTNRDMKASYYHTDSTSLESKGSDYKTHRENALNTEVSMQASIFRVVQSFDTNALLSFLESIGIYTMERNGYFYPRSEQASTVLDAFRYELEHCGIKLLCEAKLKRIQKQSRDRFEMQLEDGRTIQAGAVILATGSRAMPKSGSDGSGYDIAKSFGHSIIRPIPALTKLKCNGDFWKMVAGVRVKAKVSMKLEKAILQESPCLDEISDFGELQLSEEGLSGIPVFNISGQVKRALELKKKPLLCIDFLSEMSFAEAKDRMHKLFSHNPELEAAMALNGLVPKKLAAMFLKKLNLKGNILCEEVSSKTMEQLLQDMKAFHVIPYDTAGFDQAQVCAGGVDVSELNLATMESCLVEKLYMCGELLDVDGRCGGYNLHWAFASGYLAGLNA